MIPARILKDLAEELAPFLTEIFQRSLADGEVPMEWRSANMTAIFKKGDRFRASNYRPVSLTSLLVYVEWASRVNFVTIFGDLYQNKLWVICNNLNQFAHLSSASGPSNDVIKMAAIVLLMYTYKTSY